MTLKARIEAALDKVQNPRTGTDVRSGNAIRDLATNVNGKVRLTLLLDTQDDARLVRDVRLAVERVEGVTDVRVDVMDPGNMLNPLKRPHLKGGAGPVPARIPGQMENAPPAVPTPTREPRTLPVINSGARKNKSESKVPQPVEYPELGRIIAISSGKGGVGKSTVAVNIAIELSKQGYRVGIMDADIYGPNLPLMLGVDEAPEVMGERIKPLEAHGVKVMSIGFLIDREQPAIWRGPIVMKVITQFLRDVEWGQLDYFIVDMPPGTGDAQLSLVQATQVHGAIIVTTPQQVSIGDALRGVKMFERVAVPVLGIVENMSWFDNPATGERIAIFGSGGGTALANETRVPLLGQVPLDPRIQQGGDTGTPITVAEPDSAAGKELNSVTKRILHAMNTRQIG